MRPTFLLVACCLASLICGCGSEHDLTTQSGIEAKLQDTLSLKTVSLKARPDGGYEGTGQKTDGTNYKITVEQKSAGRLLWYTAMTDQGELSAGGFQEFDRPWMRTLNQMRKGIMIVLVLVVIVGSVIVVARNRARRTKQAEPA